MRKFINLPLILIISIFLFLSTSLLLDDPVVWPDEAIYGDISWNILNEGRMGTDLWKGFINGIENHAYSLPPMYLYSSALWYKFFGFSITTQRLFSVFLATLFMWVFYLIATRLIVSKNKSISTFLPIAATFFLSLDFVFLNAARLGRPEILVLLLTGLAMLCYLKSFEQKEVKKEVGFLYLTGLFTGLSVITHLIASGFAIAITLALLYSKGKKIFSKKRYLFFIAGTAGPIILWLILLYPNYMYLLNQLSLVQLSRNFTIVWYKNVLTFSPMLKVNYLLYLLTSVFFIVVTFKNSKKHSYILLCLVIVAGWIYATLGTLIWYTVLTIVYTYAALAAIINQVFSSKSKSFPLIFSKLVLIISCLVLFYTNLTTYIYQYNRYKNKNYYGLFTDQVSQAVPSKTTVYLSSIPDAYYAFDKGRNNLLEFPALYGGKDNFKKTLREVDYMVLNGSYIPDPEAFFYLDRYIAKNLDSAHELVFPYKVIILKMKEKNLRVDVD